MISKYKVNADRLIPDLPKTYKLKRTFFNILRYIHAQDWQGACHATSAIMFVLLREQGYEAFACLGEVSKNPIIFDHSWVEIDGKVIDAAVSNTLIRGVNFPPVLLGFDLQSGLESELDYGTTEGGGIDQQASMIASMPIGQYMDGFPGHPDGLWGIAKEVAKAQSVKFNIKTAKNKWGTSQWIVKS